MFTLRSPTSNKTVTLLSFTLFSEIAPVLPLAFTVTKKQLSAYYILLEKQQQRRVWSGLSGGISLRIYLG